MAGLTTEELISMLSEEDVYRVVFPKHPFFSEKEYTLWVIAKSLCDRIVRIKKEEAEDVNACSDANDVIIISFLSLFTAHINTHHRILAFVLSRGNTSMNRDIINVVDLEEDERVLYNRYRDLFRTSIPAHWGLLPSFLVDNMTFSSTLMTVFINEEDEDYYEPKQYTEQYPESY